jgi:hypothetical protein
MTIFIDMALCKHYSSIKKTTHRPRRNRGIETVRETMSKKDQAAQSAARSEAAHKATETKGPEGLTAAALKAWETRRANAKAALKAAKAAKATKPQRKSRKAA